MVRQEERRAATREAILDAAESLFGEEGYAATTMDDIAALAKVAKGAVYHHFTAKRDVFEAVFEAVSSRLVHSVGAGTRSDVGVIEQMVLATELYFRLCADTATAQITLRDAPGVLGYERWSELDALHFGGQVSAALALAMAAGAIEQQPVEPLAKMFLAAIQAAALNCAQAEDFASAAVPYISSLKAMLSGLATRQ